MSSYACSTRIRLPRTRRAAPALLAALALGCAAGNETSNTGGAEGGGGSVVEPGDDHDGVVFVVFRHVLERVVVVVERVVVERVERRDRRRWGRDRRRRRRRDGRRGRRERGGASSSGGGGAVVQHLVAIAVGGAGVEGARYTRARPRGSRATSAARARTPPAVTFDGNGTACAGIRSSANGGELDFTLWSAGTWTAARGARHGSDALVPVDERRRGPHRSRVPGRDRSRHEQVLLPIDATRRGA